MSETEMNTEQIEAFVGPIKELLYSFEGKKIVVVGVGRENKQLATILYGMMNRTDKKLEDSKSSVFSTLVVDGNAPAFEACMFGGEPDIVVVITNHTREYEESTTAKIAQRLLREKIGFYQTVNGLAGTATPNTDILASKSVIISTQGELQTDSMKKASSVVNFDELDSHRKFEMGLKQILDQSKSAN